MDRPNDISRQRSKARGQASVRVLWPLLEHLDAHGFSRTPVLEAAGLDARTVSDAEARVSHEAAIDAWMAAERLTGDTELGFRLAENLRRGTFGALEYAFLSSDTVGAAFQRLARYHRVLHDLAEVSLEVHDDVAVLAHRLPLPGGAPRQMTEGILASWWRTIRGLTGTCDAPRAVRFTHARPHDLSGYGRAFGDAPLSFGHERSELVFPASLLSVRMPEADAELRALMDAQVATMLESLPSHGSVVDDVRRLLARELCEGRESLTRIAARLHMSARTLHRRLQDERTSFRRVVEEARASLARRYLHETTFTAAEIAFLLGYSEPSVFHRAFRRWTGQTPQGFREAAQRTWASKPPRPFQ